MGEDKSLLPFGEYSTLIEYQYNKLSKIFSEVYISSKIDKFNFTSNIILDDSEIFSPMIALQSILKKFNNKVFIITVDTPLIKEETILELIMQSKESKIVVAKDINRAHNLLGVFSKNLLKDINICIKQNIHKINFLLKKLNTKYIEFDYSSQFININTKNEYQKALSFYKNY